MGDSAVTASETVVVSERESERHLTFNPLKTSHGGQYRGTAGIHIQPILSRYVTRSTKIYVRSKR